MHVVAIRPIGEGLLLEQLHFADEIRSFDEVPLEPVELREAELDLAKALIAQGAGEKFEPTRYRDEVRDRMLELINRKVEGEDISSAAAAPEAEHKIIDLMEALKASLRAPADKAAASASPKKASKKKRGGGRQAASA